MRVFVTLLLLAASARWTSGFYLPGVAPHEYADGEEIVAKVEKLSSIKTQLPYNYYSLPFCEPAEIENFAENLGEILRGDRIESSAFKINMKQDKTCETLCTKDYNAQELGKFRKKIIEDYKINMIVDNLPATTKIQIGDQTSFQLGFPVGFVGEEGQPDIMPGTPYLNNHFRFKILWHQDAAAYEGSRIVGFEVEAYSADHKRDGAKVNKDGSDKLATCAKNGKSDLADYLAIDKEKNGNAKFVYWTYDVIFEYSDIRWATRWDQYLHSSDTDQIHWFSIVNSILIVLFLTGMVAMILMRALNQDIKRYEQQFESDVSPEETGWKLVHGDVFRTPRHANLLSVFIGSGVQLLTMILITIGFSVLGFLSPANRGGLMTAALLLYVFMGIFAGYVSSRLYKSFKGTAWKKNTLLTAFLFPGIMFAVFFFLNLLIWGTKSSGAVPFGTLFALLFLWFGISVPLCFVGSWFGFRKDGIVYPVKINTIPRTIPGNGMTRLQDIAQCCVGGILPFGAIFIELFFILTSIWMNQMYYVFGFLLLVILILLVTCTEISICLVYFQLCNEDFHWWWRAFGTSASSGLYLFLYGIFYFITRLEIAKFVSTILYFGYMFLVSFTFTILTGTIGFIGTFYFLRKIYGAIKVD